MRRALFIAVCLWLPVTAGAAEVSVGGKAFKIPVPLGFATLTHDMQPLHDVSLDTGNPNNRRLVTFIQEDVVPLALAGETPTFERFINVDVMRALESVDATPSDYAQLQKLLGDDLDQTIARVEQLLPEKMDGLSDRVSDTLDVEMALSISAVVPLPVHRESDNAMSFSSFMKYQMSDEAGPVEFVVSATSTFLYLGGKIFFVYVYGGPDDLSWTREQSDRLIDEIIASN